MPASFSKKWMKQMKKVVLLVIQFLTRMTGKRIPTV